MNGNSRDTRALYVRNLIFGVEDSLVSTVGLLSGIATAGVGRREILLTGTVLIFVEAFSMGVGSLLSEHSVEKYVDNSHASLSRPIRGGFVMLVFYFISGFIPLFPYLVFSLSVALSISIMLSLMALFLLGALSARFFHMKILKSGVEMLLFGGAAVALGVMVGQIIQRM